MDDDEIIAFTNEAEAKMTEQAAEIDRLNALLDRPNGRRTATDHALGGGALSRARPSQGQNAVLGHASRRAGTAGFESLGAFAQAVRRSSGPGAEVDQRLRASLDSFGNESTGADGGFAVPPDFRATIWQRMSAQDSLLSMCNRVDTAGNSLLIPADLTVPWNATSGIRAFWTAEAAQIQQSKPRLQNVMVTLHKLACLVSVTEELLEDAPAVEALVTSAAGARLDWSISEAIAFGSGVGQPLGFTNSPVLIEQPGESGQSAGTVLAQNVVNMLARLPSQSRTNAAWIIHPDVEPQLNLMTLGDQPIYVPPGGFSSAPYARLMGLPVIPHQVAQPLGARGDIMLVDLSQYLAAVKAGGVRAQTSMHLFFDQDATAFRFTVRIAGQPWWSEQLPDANGSGTRSPFVTLAPRT